MFLAASADTLSRSWLLVLWVSGTWVCRSSSRSREAGEEVIAVDVDQRKIDAMTAGESYIEDIPSERLRAVLPKMQREHALRAAGPHRGGHGLRADAADRQPRAGPRAA